MTHRTSEPTFRDVAWIVSLWRALHGEISIEDIAAEVIAGLSPYLPVSESSFQSCELLLGASALFDFTDIQKESSDPQIEVSQPAAAPHLEPETHEFSIHHYYFKFKGRRYCLELPALTHSPTAA